MKIGSKFTKRELAIRVSLWIGIALGVIALAKAVLPYFAGDERAEVEIAEATIFNPSKTASPPTQTEPAVTATVRNIGDQTAYVDEAQITVYDGTRMGICFNQGGGPDVPESKPYRATMPEFPTSAVRVIHLHLHVEVQPGRGARPLVKFQKRSESVTGLYSIGVKYVVDPGEEILNVGRFVIGVPGAPQRGSYFLPEDETALVGGEYWNGLDEIPVAVVWCLRHNLVGMRRIIAEPGARSLDVKALSELQLAPSWSEVVEDESPREAVEELFEVEGLDTPLYAVEAAALTGDQTYEDEVRERAARLLSEHAEGDLQDAGSGDIQAIEGALSIEPTAASRKLLAKVKVAAAEAEQRRLAELEAEEVVSESGG